MDINKVVYKNGKIALYDTYESGNKDLVEYLVVKYGDYIINKENKSFETPLFRACKSGNKYLVEEYRANINKKKKRIIKHHYSMHAEVEIKI